ncbi:hypothetical protein NEFER03_2132 [Nematocida sp. LUAm3]|nr:hypothetical protein NEFER03_2132 [Nematocida sp. LUAm3]KAI5174480.1 hypothetical protein NEFER02_0601 [Nematocida sp. LUAm2]KAI5177950.1 hypothetical protein NEFER01_1132 [Nematocida sp. LUAm1]
MDIYTRLKEIRREAEHEEIEELIQEAVQTKQKRMDLKHSLIEIADMLMINRINLLAEMEFVANKTKAKALHYQTEKKKVSELVEYFSEKTSKINQLK